MKSIKKPSASFRSVFTFAAILIFYTGLAVAENGQGHPLFSFTVSGSFNQPGKVFKIDPSAGYRFNNHFEIDAGWPVYMVRPSDAGIAAGFSSNNGIGNAYLDLRFFVSHPDLYFSSNVRGTAPTGSTSDGFSTGRVTLDWSNYLQKDFGRFTPFGNVGVANSISDTPFFNRPFTTLGLVGHFEGGAYYELFRHFSIAGSAYAITPSGEQKVYSRLLKRAGPTSTPGGSAGMGKANGRNRVFETSSITTGNASIARDHGYSGWIDFHPQSHIALEIGYSRSVTYALDTVFFSASFDLGTLLSSRRR